MSSRISGARACGPPEQRIVIPLARAILKKIAVREGHYDRKHQLAEADLGNLIRQLYVGEFGTAAASGEAFENYVGTLLTTQLDYREGWVLHAARMGNAIVLRAHVGRSPVPRNYLIVNNFCVPTSRRRTIGSVGVP